MSMVQELAMLAVGTNDGSIDPQVPVSLGRVQ